MKNVLVIEDDREIVELLEIHLADLDCSVSKAYSGDLGLEKALSEDPDLIILDVTLPNMDGVEVCQKIRGKKNTPIIMLTAKSEEIDRVLGLEVGADDYITKPFSIREFIARVKAIFRRSRMQVADSSENPLLQFERLSIDIEKRKVMVDDRKVELSPKEFELLVLMASHPGRCYSRTNLLKMVWGYDFEGYEHTVNSHINRLRSKIESDMNAPQFIMTEWGVGYKFNEEMAAR
jgi:DNA-binding response OmpR family regulator